MGRNSIFLCTACLSCLAGALAGCGGAVGAGIWAASTSGGGGSSDARPLVEDLAIRVPSTPDRVHVEFRVRNDDGGELCARIEYTVDGVRHPASPAPGSALLCPVTAGELVRFVWDAGRDLGGASALVRITVTPTEGGREGIAASVGPVRAGNAPVTVEDMELSSREDILFVFFRVSDAESDRARLRGLEFSLCGDDETWIPAPPLFLDELNADFAADPDGETGSFSFSVLELDRPELGFPESLRALARPGFVGDLRVRVCLSDYETEEPSYAESDCSSFDFNDEPFVQFLPLPAEALSSGVIPIRYRIFDREENPADVELDVDLGDGLGFRPVIEFPGPASEGTHGLSTLPILDVEDSALPFHTFLWDALEQTAPRAQASLRLRAIDRERGPSNLLFAEVSRELVRHLREIPSGGNTPFTAGDFNGDGFPDALLLDVFLNSSDRAAIFLAGGRRGLSPRGEPLDVGPGEACWAGTGDFNGDGFLDAAFYCYAGSRWVRVFLGSPDGLTEAPGGPLELEGVPLFSASVDLNDLGRSADFDGDGYDDLLVQIPEIGDIQFVKGGPNGLVPGELLLPPGPEARVHDPWAIIIDDFNDDGLPDVIMANRGRGDVTVIRGSRQGPKWVKFVRLPREGAWAEMLVTGRFDGDDYPDALAVDQTSSSLSFLPGHEDWEAALEVREDGTLSLDLTPGSFVSSGDFNGDSLTDAVVLHRELPILTVVLGHPVQPFVSETIHVGAGASLLTGFAQAGEDIDGDGFSDAVVAANPMSFLRGSPEGLTFHSKLETKLARPHHIVDDFDADGVPDLIVADGDGTSVRHLEGVRGGLGQAGEAISIEDGAVAAASADFDGDGFPDLATANRDSGTVSFLRGRPGGLSGARSIPLGESARPGSLVAGDFDFGDEGISYPDLLVLDFDAPRVSLLRGGPEGLSPAGREDFDVVDTPRAAALGDFDGDGSLDAAIGSWTRGEVQLLRGGADGLRPDEERLPVGHARVVALLSGDFDRDGRLDLLSAHWTAGSVTCIFGGDEGLGSESIEMSIGHSPHAFAAEDFDGDGWLEVAVLDWGGDSVHVLDFTPARSIDTRTISVGEFPVALAASDFDGDGFQDLAVTNFGSESLSLLRGQPTGLAAAEELAALADGQPTTLMAEDVDGDGYPDALLANQGTGELVRFLGGPSGLRWGGIVARLNRPDVLVGSDFDADGFADLVVVDTAAGEVAFLRQSYLTPHAQARLDAVDAGTLPDPRSPPRYELAIEAGSLPGPTPLTIAPARLFPLPQAEANERGKYLIAVTETVALLREDATPLNVPARLTLRLLERAPLFEGTDSLRVFRRGSGEPVPTFVERVEDFGNGRAVAFDIDTFGVYVVAEERQREGDLP